MEEFGNQKPAGDKRGCTGIVDKRADCVVDAESVM
jgi:hypothetical protein